MNWGDLERDSTRRILEYWRKLGRFRLDHPAVGAGVHRTLQRNPYVFSRVLDVDEINDRVLVALDEPVGPKTIRVHGVFPDGARLTDAYSGERTEVRRGAVSLQTDFGIVLLSARPAAEGASSDDVVLLVTDNYVQSVEVYASANNVRYRMGTVLPGIESRFIVRQAMLGDGPVEFTAIPADGVRTLSSGGLLLRPGDMVRFVITTHLIGSYADVSP